MKKPKRFFVTFGQKFRHEVHPLQEKGIAKIHPDGLLCVVAESENDVQKYLNEKCGGEYHNVHLEERLKDVIEHFPRGIIDSVNLVSMSAETQEQA